ncbi:hypothetical protein HOE37_06705 [Candidatus Woesearchaeota archaeon]|jgi:hypothetical protein|nr:hypothetical protein [Candidatus Woesearchaeota archaeon]
MITAGYLVNVMVESDNGLKIWNEYKDDSFGAGFFSSLSSAQNHADSLLSYIIKYKKGDFSKNPLTLELDNFKHLKNNAARKERAVHAIQKGHAVRILEYNFPSVVNIVEVGDFDATA